MVIINDNIHVLCGARADEAANEERDSGIFTRELIRALKLHPTLLTLPLDLNAWQRALPSNLLQDNKIALLDQRGVLGDAPRTSNQSQEPVTSPPDFERRSQHTQAV